MNENKKNSVKIAVRECPSRNSMPNGTSCVTFVEAAVLCDGKPFVFDQIFRSDASQVDVFTSLAAPLVSNVLDGFNSTLFAYGQSGTGKSFSMGLNPDSFDCEAMGIIPRSLGSIFENTENTGDAISISCSFLEIYNEKVYDLFDNINFQKPMIRPNDAERKDVKSVKGGLQLLREAHKIRRFRPTNLNAVSSRAHSIVTIHIAKDNGNGSRSLSCLNLVDLAGTEGVRKTGHMGMALTEGNHINSSLLAVSKIINTLSNGNKPISFRDSVLTKVLQESFSLNACLALLVCISSDQEDLCETKSALQFAKNAKNINMSSQLSKEIEIIRKTTPLSQKHATKLTTTAKKRTLSSTFNSVSKLPKMSAMKVNQSEVFKRPALQRQLKYDFQTPAAASTVRTTMSSPNVIESTQDFEFNHPSESFVPRRIQRISSFESIDSRFSIQSLNVSTSTSVDEISTIQSRRPSTSSQSPLIRKCMDIFNNAMSKKLDMIHETLQTPAHPRPSIDTEMIRTMIRQELNTFMTATKRCGLPVEHVEDSPINQYRRRSIEASSLPSIDEEMETIVPTSTPAIAPAETVDVHGVQLPANLNTSTPKRCTTDSSTVPLSRKRVEPTISVMAMRRSARLSVCSTPPSLNELKLRRNMIETRKKEIQIPPPNDRKKRKPESFVLHPKPQTDKESMKKAMKKNILKVFNEGDLKELQKMPSIGAKKASTVITFRSMNGPLKKFKNIRDVPIWSDKTWQNFLALNCLN